MYAGEPRCQDPASVSITITSIMKARRGKLCRSKVTVKRRDSQKETIASSQDRTEKCPESGIPSDRDRSAILGWRPRFQRGIDGIRDNQLMPTGLMMTLVAPLTPSPRPSPPFESLATCSSSRQTAKRLLQTAVVFHSDSSRWHRRVAKSVGWGGGER